MITVQKAGVLTSVMDLGRTGYQRLGIVVGGALDRFSARVANTLVGNHENAALLEIAQRGPELHFAADTLVAWCGADFDPRIDTAPLPRDRVVQIRAGETIRFGAAKSGLRAWLAVAGGLDVPLVLGSRSTYRRGAFGGFQGRPLKAGDNLTVGALSEWAEKRLQSAQRVSPWSVRPETLGRQAAVGTVRAMPGPEWEWFSRDAHRDFFTATWMITKDADRMGAQLAGPALKLAEEREMISEGVNEGVVQVANAGQPIVLLASRQTVGGYPRIGAVASVDLGRMAQLVPGATLRFEPVTIAEAHKLYLAREHDFARVRTGLARLSD